MVLFLNKNRPHSVDSIAGAFFSILAGVFYFSLLFPWDFIGGDSSYWQTEIQDVTQYISGLTVFRSEPWQWPIFFVQGINWPQGTTVTFLDSIPLFAVLVKLFDPLFPSNPYGIWVFLCFVLQGFAAWWAARQMRLDSWLVTILVILLCLQMPVLALRLGHISLMSHFYIIFALGIYIRSIVSEDNFILGWAVLLFCSFYTNLYICAMVCAVLFASAADAFVRRKQYKLLFLYIIPFLAVALTISLTMYGAVGAAVNHGGFGYFSMNALSPFIGGSILKFPFYEYGTPGQGEGANYLGLGAITLILATFVFRKQLTTKGVQSGVFLTAVCIACWIFALSNDVYFSSFHALHWETPAFAEMIVQTFRASGRIFWLPAYAMIIFSALKLSGLSKRWLFASVTAVLMLQAIDLEGIRENTKTAATREPEIAIEFNQWKPFLENVDTIYLYPKYTCGNADHADILPIQALAAEQEINLSTGYIARYGPDCSLMTTEIESSDLQTSTYVFVKKQFSLKDAQEFLDPNVVCRELNKWIVCRLDEI